MCKHVAAVLYGVGARLDQSPELFFVLRQVDQAELVAGANAAEVLATAAAGAGTSGKKRIATGAVAAVFGIELDEEPPVAKKSGRTQASVRSAPSAKKKAGRKRASVPSEAPVAVSVSKTKTLARKRAGARSTQR
jgi:uncharacterized Zn finger protein